MNHLDRLLDRVLDRLSLTLSPASMLVAILSLLVAAAGTGYAAGTIGTSDIKDGAVTSAKVRNGSLRNADLTPEDPVTYVGRKGAPAFGNGGEGDCIWRSAHTQLPGVARPGFRTDRFGTVHLTGIALPEDGAGGDGECQNEVDDNVIFVLPRAAWPARTQYLPVRAYSGLLIVGPTGYEDEQVAIAPGSVVWGGPSEAVVLDGVSFPSARTRLYPGSPSGTVSREGADLLQDLLAGRAR